MSDWNSIFQGIDMLGRTKSRGYEAKSGALSEAIGSKKDFWSKLNKFGVNVDLATPRRDKKQQEFQDEQRIAGEEFAAEQAKLKEGYVDEDGNFVGGTDFHNEAGRINTMSDAEFDLWLKKQSPETLEAIAPFLDDASRRRIDEYQKTADIDTGEYGERAVVATDESVREAFAMFGAEAGDYETFEKNYRDRLAYVETLSKERQADYLRLQANLNAAARGEDDEFNATEAYDAALSLTLLPYQHSGAWHKDYGWVDKTIDKKTAQAVLAGFAANTAKLTPDQQLDLQTRLYRYLDTVSPDWNVPETKRGGGDGKDLTSVEGMRDYMKSLLFAPERGIATEEDIAEEPYITQLSKLGDLSNSLTDLRRLTHAATLLAKDGTTQEDAFNIEDILMDISKTLNIPYSVPRLIRNDSGIELSL